MKRNLRTHMAIRSTTRKVSMIFYVDCGWEAYFETNNFVIHICKN